MDTDGNLIYAFILTLLAGLSTAVGGLIAFTKYARREKYLAFGLGLAAGAMIFISFFELLFGALEYSNEQEDDTTAFVRVAGMFIGGIIVVGVLGAIMKSITDKMGFYKTDIRKLSQDSTDPEKTRKLYKSGIITAIALAIHNLPEGLVTFLATMQDLQLGIGIAIAIAVHNLPEGMAVAMPIYFATKNKKKAILITLASGLSEPVGAIVAYLLFFKDLSQDAMEAINVFLASIMVYVSFFELLPTSFQLGYESQTKWGLILGMVLMGGSLMLLM